MRRLVTVRNRTEGASLKKITIIEVEGKSKQKAFSFEVQTKF